MQINITFSNQTLLGILIAVLVIGLLLALVIGIKRRLEQPREGRRRRHRRDHGARIAQRHGHQRSPHWQRVEKEHLKREPSCVACGHRGHGVQVHHVKPFHLHPDLELDPDNLITLCEIKGRDHHLLLGHLDEWESYNPHVRTDVKLFHKKSDKQIRADLAWQKKVLHRPTS